MRVVRMGKTAIGSQKRQEGNNVGLAMPGATVIVSLYGWMVGCDESKLNGCSLSNDQIVRPQLFSGPAPGRYA